MQKVFVTGVAGFIGSHLADRLRDRGCQVVGIDNMIGGYHDNIPKGIEFHEADCLDQLKMAHLIKGCDTVYHCAATAYEGLSVFSPHLVTQNVYGATVGVLSAAIASGVKRWVQLSSMARYGSQQTPFTEDMTPRPEDPYGIAKAAADATVENLCDTHGVEYVIAVPHNVIGPRQKYDDIYRNVASIMINRILLGMPPIIYGDGEQKRCFSFIQDVIDPLEKLGTLPNVVGKVINIGPDEEFVTINRLAHVISELLDFEDAPIYMPGRPREVRFATCSADRARRLLGYKTTTSLRDGLRSIIDYIRTRGPRPFDYQLPLEIVNDLTPKTWMMKKEVLL